MKQEFAERVSKKRKLLLYAKLSDALKHFEVPVTPQEEAAEAELLKLLGDLELDTHDASDLV